MSSLNIEINNPFILASGPPTRTGEMIAEAFKAGWGGAVTKTICLNYEQMTDVSPRVIKVNGGMKNIELISNRPPEDWAEDIRFLKREFPKNTIIASISAEANNSKAWEKLTILMQKAGADVLELNFSCPHGLPELGMGTTCSDFPDIAGNIVKIIKTASKIPIWAKLSPNVTNIGHLAKICIENGADGITAINSVKGFAGVDIETGLPRLNVANSTTYGGISGEIIKPFALKAVSEIASAVDCRISAVGGVKNWQDAVEFILLGASTVQICTEVMLNGYEIINNLQNGLSEYLKKHKINSISDIKGNSLVHIKPYAGLDNSVKATPVFEYSKCIKCRKCVKTCFESGYQAITTSNSGFPDVNMEKCSGCGLCKIICPVKCIELAEKEKIMPHF